MFRLFVPTLGGGKEKYMPDKKMLLIVEDNELNREILVAILEDEYDVLTAENGAVGLSLVHEYGNKLSIILLDIQMPVMNGYEFLSTIAEEVEHTDIPIIVTTTSDSDEEQIRCLGLGASEFVAKPYNPNVIKQRIKSLIRLRETVDMLREIELDCLTGLYNKEAFCIYMGKHLSDFPDKDFDLVCLEVDSYSQLRRRYGKDNCEEIIKNLADRVSAMLPDYSLIGRIEDSQLSVLVPHMSEQHHSAYMEKCKNASYSSLIPNVKIDCGVYQNVQHDTDPFEIISNSQLALDKIRYLYDKNIAFFDDSIRERLSKNELLKNAAKKGLEEKQFQVYFQPKIDAASGKVRGAEALIRWIHPKLGFISPGEFIPLFESNGFVYEVDKFVLEGVCEFIRKRLDEGKFAVPVSSNISQMDFDHPDLADVLVEIVDRYNIPHEFIHFEITESVDAVNKLSKVKSISELKKNGFIIEIDDFGSGYSTLSVLGEFPIDVMKIDMSLIRNMFDPKFHSILNGVLYTASSLCSSVVAEGVETHEQEVELLNMCGGRIKLYIQGYCYSKPIPASDFEVFLKEHK